MLCVELSKNPSPSQNRRTMNSFSLTKKTKEESVNWKLFFLLFLKMSYLVMKVWNMMFQSKGHLCQLSLHWDTKRSDDHEFVFDQQERFTCFSWQITGLELLRDCILRLLPDIGVGCQQVSLLALTEKTMAVDGSTAYGRTSVPPYHT